MAITIGVDVGGTFTDFLMVDTDSGEVRTEKVPTTVDDRARGFLDGIDRLGVAPGDIRWLVHGTTAGIDARLTNHIDEENSKLDTVIDICKSPWSTPDDGR